MVLGWHERLAAFLLGNLDAKPIIVKLEIANSDGAGRIAPTEGHEGEDDV